MNIPIVREVVPFVLGSLVLFGGLGAIAFKLRRRTVAVAMFILALLGTGYMLFFFRDPARQPPHDPAVVVSGADGVIMHVLDLREDEYLKTDAVRISIFLSLFDVHVNRAPIAGKSSFLGYFPGRHFFTFDEKSSDANQHNKILIEGQGTRCLVNQIVGPVARRVVYWPPHDRAVELEQGARIGMMKFGSRLDMILPRADVEVTVDRGDRVVAGETVVARIKQQP